MNYSNFSRCWLQYCLIAFEICFKGIWRLSTIFCSSECTNTNNLINIIAPFVSINSSIEIPTVGLAILGNFKRVHSDTCIFKFANRFVASDTRWLSLYRGSFTNLTICYFDQVANVHLLKICDFNGRHLIPVILENSSIVHGEIIHQLVCSLIENFNQSEHFTTNLNVSRVELQKEVEDNFVVFNDFEIINYRIISEPRAATFNMLERRSVIYLEALLWIEGCRVVVDHEFCLNLKVRLRCILHYTSILIGSEWGNIVKFRFPNIFPWPIHIFISPCVGHVTLIAPIIHGVGWSERMGHYFGRLVENTLVDRVRGNLALVGRNSDAS